MGKDEPALLRLWREKRGEAEPEDLSGNLIVQLGVVTEPLNRHWFERDGGQVLIWVQLRHRMSPTDGPELINPPISLPWRRRGHRRPPLGRNSTVAVICAYRTSENVRQVLPHFHL